MNEQLLADFDLDEDGLAYLDPEQPAFWMFVYVAAAVLILLGFHWGFRGAVAS